MFAGRDANATISDFVDRDIVAASQKYQLDDEISYIDISSVNGTFHGIEGVQSYLFKDAPSRAQQCVIEGDILFSLVRPNLKKMAIVTARHDQSVASTGFCVIRPKDGSTGFLQCLLQSDQFTNAMVDVAKGTSYPAVTNKQVLGYHVPEPSSDEKNQLTELVQQTDKSKFMDRKILICRAVQ